MKTKSLVTGMALTGALLASASVAKANAFMELISGSSVVKINPGMPDNIYGGNYEGQTGDGAIFVGTIGTWSVDIASGGESGAFNVTLSDNINSSTTQTHGLEVIFSSGAYNLGTLADPGHYNYGASDSGGNSLTATVTGYYNTSAMYTGTGSLHSYENSSVSLEPSSTVSPTDPAGPWVLQKTYAQSYQNVDIPIYGNDYITEVMLFGGTTGTIPAQKVTMNAVASFTPYVTPSQVPDGGATATMAGCTLLGLVGLKSKFGSKRS
jgi:hypothetical protein